MARSHILHDVGMTVAEGRITVLPWAATAPANHHACASLVGLTPPAGGRVAIRTGHHAAGAVSVATLGVGYVPEGRRIFT